MCPFLGNHTPTLVNDPQTLFSWSFVHCSVGGSRVSLSILLVRFQCGNMLLLLLLLDLDPVICSAPPVGK